MKYQSAKKLIYYKCVICGVDKGVWPSEYKRSHPRFCSHACMSVGKSLPLTEFKCDGCGKMAKRRRYKIESGKPLYCTHACFLKNASILPTLTGEKHYLWKGGNDPKKKNLTLNKKWRKAVLERDGYKCVYCGSNEKLEADHLWPAFFAPELVLDIDNGQTLCQKCHKKTFTWGTKNLRFLREVRKALGNANLKELFPFEEIIHTFDEMKKNGEI